MAHKIQPAGGFDLSYTRYLQPTWESAAPWLTCPADVFVSYYLPRFEDGRLPRPNLEEVENACMASKLNDYDEMT